MKRGRTVAKWGYDEYMKSEAWARKKAEFRRSKLFKNRCHACVSTDRLHIHHLTYSRLGNEYLKDLVALCEACHAEVHRRHRQTKGASLPQTTRHYIKQRWDRDLSRPKGTGPWGKRYHKRWMAKHYPQYSGRSTPVKG